MLANPAALEVLKAFIPKVLAESTLTYERFREITKAVQKETGKKGKDLFHPIRMAVTGAASGPELEKLIPIYEEGAKLPLPQHVKSVAERLREFAEAAKLDSSQCTVDSVTNVDSGASRQHTRQEAMPRSPLPRMRKGGASPECKRYFGVVLTASPASYSGI